jgi:hypothetical protein
MSLKLSKLLYKENSGDFSGAGTFQGGAYGFGNRHQLADSEIWPGLVDPEEDLPNEPSMWPAVRAQKGSDRDENDSLESSEVYDDRPHLLPGQDEVRDQLLDPENDIEPSYYYVTERGPSDGNYRDLQGFPAMNTLSNPIEHIPDDEDEDRDPDAPEEERYNVPQLLPGGREAVRGEPFGHGHYDKPEELNMSLNSKDTSMYDPMDDEITDNNLKLTQKRNKTLNRWKETTPTDRGQTNRDVVFNHLVNPVNWIKKEFGQTDYKKELDEEDDVPTRAGFMGTVAHPVKHVPGSVDIYKKGSGPGYYRNESKEIKMSKSDKESTKRKLVDYLPAELDKKMPEKPYGTGGFASIVKKFDHGTEERDLKEIEPLEPEENYIPYDNGKPQKFDVIMQTKLFDKLAKLAKKDKK